MILTNKSENPSVNKFTMMASPQSNCIIMNSVSQGNVNAKQLILSQPQKRPLAPAPSENIRMPVNMSDAKCKRKINFSAHMPYPGHQPASVARRNARERNRVKQVNNGFATLRQHIPSTVTAALTSHGNSRGASKKLSKVETLRLAVEYIRSLQQMLDDYEAEVNSTTSSCPTDSSSPSVSLIDVNPIMNNYYTALEQDAYHIDSKDTFQTHLDTFEMEHHLGQAAMILQQSPPCSEASASPTPSFASENSVPTTPTYALLTNYQTEHFDKYEPMSPEDEELLDVITMWQQQ